MNFSRIMAAAALAGVLAVPLAAGAQTMPGPAAAPSAPAHGHGRHHGNRFMRALHSLNLSAEQKTQIRNLARANRAADANADRATRKANAGKLHAQIEGVLTPEQRTQLQAALQRERTAPPASR